MDNHSDPEDLQSRAGKQAVVDTHVEGIVEWLENLKSMYICDIFTHINRNSQLKSKHNLHNIFNQIYKLLYIR